MANGGGYGTEKIRLPSSLPRWVSALWPIVVVGAGIFAAWQVQSYRLERVEKDVVSLQSTVQIEVPRIREELVEIKAELRWMSRALGVPAKKD